MKPISSMMCALDLNVLNAIKTRKFMRQILFFWTLCLLFSCQGERGSVQNFASLSDSLPLEEKQALLPNELFTAVVDQKGEKVLQDIIDKNGEFLLDTNEKGDSPLGVALQFENPEGALFLAKQLSPEHYPHQNNKGESYIYLSAQKGYVDVLKFLGRAFYESKWELFADYEFSDLDQKTKEGERALHVAKNAMTAEALEYEHWRGTLEFPFRKFQFLRTNRGQTFLHTAVRDRNEDLLRWGLSQSCRAKKEWEERGPFKRFFSFLWRGVQSYGKPVLDWDDLINTRDEEKLTAVNLSAKNSFYEGIRLFADCQWTDWLLKDNKGNIPLQNFLLSLDRLKLSHDSSAKEMLSFLIERKTRLTFAVLADHLNSLNEEGDSSLHISARMADPSFYNQLKKYGDIEQLNHQNQSPREIFRLTRKQIGDAF